MNDRIIGIDVARALAVIGMILVNFKLIFGHSGQSWLNHFSDIFDGKAAATFVVLAGVGLAFMTSTSHTSNDPMSWNKARIKIIKRALLLFIIGISYINIWPADILHFYGVYMLGALILIKTRPRYLLLAALVLILVYPGLMMLFDYDTGWDFSTFKYQNFWSIKGFFRNLFFNGFHPVVPWTGFMLIGIWYGRQNLNDVRFLKKSIIIGLALFVTLKLLSTILIQLFSEGNQKVANELRQVLGTSPMPPLPIYMLSGSCIAISIISACILVSSRFSYHPIIKTLVYTGQMALTFYVAHVVLGVGLVEFFGNSELGTYSLNFSIAYALLFSMGCVAFALLWRRFCSIGPLEWVMRQIED